MAHLRAVQPWVVVAAAAVAAVPCLHLLEEEVLAAVAAAVRHPEVGADLEVVVVPEEAEERPLEEVGVAGHRLVAVAAVAHHREAVVGRPRGTMQLSGKTAHQHPASSS